MDINYLIATPSLHHNLPPYHHQPLPIMTNPQLPNIKTPPPLPTIKKKPQNLHQKTKIRAQTDALPSINSPLFKAKSCNRRKPPSIKLETVWKKHRKSNVTAQKVVCKRKKKPESTQIYLGEGTKGIIYKKKYKRGYKE